MRHKIRTATEVDLPEVARLIREAGMRELPTQSQPFDTHLLVVEYEAGRQLLAVVMLALASHGARVELIAVDVRSRVIGLEERILRVCDSVCRAYRCDVSLAN